MDIDRLSIFKEEFADHPDAEILIEDSPFKLDRVYGVKLQGHVSSVKVPFMNDYSEKTWIQAARLIRNSLVKAIADSPHLAGGSMQEWMHSAGHGELDEYEHRTNQSSV